MGGGGGGGGGWGGDECKVIFLRKLYIDNCVNFVSKEKCISEHCKNISKSKVNYKAIYPIFKTVKDLWVFCQKQIKVIQTYFVYIYK